MGLAAVQLGVHMGASVIATGTDESRLAAAKQCGAQHCLLLGNNLHEQVKALTDGVGAQVVFDPVGGDAFDQSVRAIAKQGRLLVVGFASGRIAQLATNIALIKELSVIGVRAGEYGRRQPGLGKQNELAIQALAEQGVMTPWIGAQFSFDQAKQAFTALRERSAAGIKPTTRNLNGMKTWEKVRFFGCERWRTKFDLAALFQLFHASGPST